MRFPFLLLALCMSLWTALGNTPGAAPGHASGAAPAPTPPPSSYRTPDKWLSIDGGLLFPYYTTHTTFDPIPNSIERDENGDIDEAVYRTTWPEVEAVLIIVHGSGRNAAKMIDRAMATDRYQSNRDKIAIISPLFQYEADRDVSKNEHYWCAPWRWDHAISSCDSSPISSYEVLDNFYEYIGHHFPNAKHMTLSGHSAGGQLTNRYAAAGDGPNILKRMIPNIELRFMPMNPGSYLYIETQNPELWKYGLGDVTSRDYVQEYSDVNDMIRQLTERKVYYLVGNKDKKAPSTFDMSPPAAKQGPNRRERFRNYLAYVEEKTTPSLPWKENSRFFVVKGSGHQSAKMMKDSKAQAIMFASHAEMMAELEGKDWVNGETVIDTVGQTCKSSNMKPLKEDECKGVAIRLHLEWTGAVDAAILDTVPRGCLKVGNKLYWASKTPANKGIGSTATHKRICRPKVNDPNAPSLVASSEDSDDASADDSVDDSAEGVKA